MMKLSMKTKMKVCSETCLCVCVRVRACACVCVCVGWCACDCSLNSVYSMCSMCSMSALLVVLAISNVLAGLDVFRMSILTGESDNKSTTGRLWSPIDFPEGAFSMCVCNVCVCVCV